MGSKVYDFLMESFLFDESLIEEQFVSIPEEEIRKELVAIESFGWSCC